MDTATAATTVAVVEVGDDGALDVQSERRFLDPRAHGEQLAPHISQALDAAGIRPEHLDAIVAGTGPGPFTGLRVGLATAAAMGQTLGVPTYGVCSLDGIGAAADEPGSEPVLVATDARRREIYWGLYTDGSRVSGPEVNRPDQLLPLIAARGIRRAYGEGALRYRRVLSLPVAEDPLYPKPVLLVANVVQRILDRAPSEPLVPLYLRRPDAAEPRPPKPAPRS